jgi:hypothetical protein
MRQRREDYPKLSTDEWYAVAAAYRAAESGADVSLFSVIGECLKSAFRSGEGAPMRVTSREGLLRDFVSRTRRDRIPANDLAAALQASGFSAEQVAALALLSIH